MPIQKTYEQLKAELMSGVEVRIHAAIQEVMERTKFWFPAWIYRKYGQTIGSLACDDVHAQTFVRLYNTARIDASVFDAFPIVPLLIEHAKTAGREEIRKLGQQERLAAKLRPLQAEHVLPTTDHLSDMIRWYREFLVSLPEVQQLVLRIYADSALQGKALSADQVAVDGYRFYGRKITVQAVYSALREIRAKAREDDGFDELFGRR